MWITITTNNNLFYGILMGKLKGKYGKPFKVAGLKENSPGVMVNDKFKPGKDPALDSVLDKLKKNPSGLDSSGMGTHWKVKKTTKSKKRTA